MALAPVLLAVLAAGAALALLLSPAGRRLLPDRPNARSLHAEPVPRSGGLAIAAGVLAGALAAPAAPAAALLLAGGLCLLSLADDVASLPTLLRFAAHLAAAGAFAGFAAGAGEPWLLALLTLSIAWFTNLFNFMDGSDGLAGGMAAFGFGAYALAAQQAGEGALATSSACVAVAALVFLAANFPPAKLFMGDAGSVPLGFLAGALGVEGWRAGAWPAWFPALVFAPFVVDATLTLAKRALRGEPVWRAHRSHYYQRLVQMGAGHRGTAIAAYAAMAACAVLALAARAAGPAQQAAALGLAALGLAACAAWIDARWRRFGASKAAP